MGNEQSEITKEYGSIYLKTDKPFYYEGETVNGAIYMYYIIILLVEFIRV